MNKRPYNVRKQAPALRTKTDRRVLRTRRALGSALVELMLARKFNDISVQQVLDRANVGRATFYAHFRNKYDLLLSDAERFFETFEEHFLRSETGSRRVAPVDELFSHVADYHAFQRALKQSGLQEPVYDLLASYLARMIERRIATLRPNTGNGTLSRPVISRVFAGALVELLRWWIDRVARPSPEEMDKQFHEIVWSGLGRAR